MCPFFFSKESSVHYEMRETPSSMNSGTPSSTTPFLICLLEIISNYLFNNWWVESLCAFIFLPHWGLNTSHFFWPIFHADKNQNGKVTIDNGLFFSRCCHDTCAKPRKLCLHGLTWGSGSCLGTLWRAAGSDDQTLCLLMRGWPLLPPEEQRANFTRQQL